MTLDPTTSIEEFVEDARAWLDSHAERRAASAEEFEWGSGTFSVAVFHAMTHDEEAAYLRRITDWIQLKASRGLHAVAWPAEFGGLGLPREFAREFARLERRYDTPGRHELISVTTHLIVETVKAFGTEAQKRRFVGRLLSAEILACQLFSEPGAGSDLAGLGCRAERDGDEWLINGQKVWSSGAQFSHFGELIARTDPDEVKHRGMTAFMLPLDTPGVDVRPIAQMSGGASFCEVFLNDVRISDDLRLGDVGEGWNVALTTLGFERDHSESGADTSAAGGSWRQLVATARAMGVTHDSVIRDRLSDVYIRSRVESLTNRRAADLARSGTPGPESSLGKLLWTEGMRRMSDVVSLVLGAKLVADTSEWGTFAWAEHVLGAPGYRIAGGSDEIQRNIIGERVLGLPREPRADVGPWRSIPR